MTGVDLSLNDIKGYGEWYAFDFGKGLIPEGDEACIYKNLIATDENTGMPVIATD